MAVTRLKRKGRRNKLRAKIRAQKLKLENFTPVIKNVDIETIKEEFKAAAAATISKAKPKATAGIEEKVETKTDDPTKAKSTKSRKPKSAEKVTPKKKAATPKAEKKEKSTTAKASSAKKKVPAKKKTAPKAKKKD